MVDLAQPVDLDDPGAQSFLEAVQGNIIKGQGRDHTAHIFLVFPPDAVAMREWIAGFAATRVTSARAQHEQTLAFRRKRDAGAPFVSLLLSAQGYTALGLDDRAPADPLFRAGLRRHNEVSPDPINDPPVATWEPGYREGVHAMVLLADDDRARLDALESTLVADVAALGMRSFVERGDKLLYNFGPPRGVLEIEHFGHQDGVSNPRMVVADIEEERAARGAQHWDPQAALDLVFVDEPGSGAHGSYMVFRKLEQNVRAFHEAKTGLARLLAIDVDGAATLMVGRHRDGTPVMPTTTLDPRADPNDFTYADDRPQDGVPARMCPFHAHIRRTNPRGDVPHYIGAPEAFERSMRIARRGITYGERPYLYNPDPSVLPSAGVGLLFMSFQANLRQFAIQQSGSDSDTFPFVSQGAFSGLETVIGQAADAANVRPQVFPYQDANGPAAVREMRMINFVKMMGGEYFFAPSLTFLRSLVRL